MIYEIEVTREHLDTEHHDYPVDLALADLPKGPNSEGAFQRFIEFAGLEFACDAALVSFYEAWYYGNSDEYDPFTIILDDLRGTARMLRNQKTVGVESSVTGYGLCEGKYPSRSAYCARS